MEDTGIWAAPLLLLSAVGLLVLSTSARFGQVHEEFHRRQVCSEPYPIAGLIRCSGSPTR